MSEATERHRDAEEATETFQRGDGLLPLSFAVPFAMTLLATEGKVDMKTAALLFKNVN